MFDVENICFICLSSTSKNNFKTFLNPDVKSHIIFAFPELIFRHYTCVCPSCYSTITSYNTFKTKALLNYKRWVQYRKTIQQSAQLSKYRKLQIRLTNCAPPPSKLKKKTDIDINIRQEVEETITELKELPDTQINNKLQVKQEEEDLPNIKQENVSDEDQQVFVIKLNINEDLSDQKTVKDDLTEEPEVYYILTEQKTFLSDLNDQESVSDTIDFKDDPMKEDLIEETEEKTDISNLKENEIEDSIDEDEIEELVVEPDLNDNPKDSDYSMPDTESESEVEAYSLNRKRNGGKDKRSYDPYIDLECTLCKEVLEDKLLYKIHMKVHSEEINGEECPVCHKTFKDNITCRNHYMLHFNMKEFKCNGCFKTFVTRQALVYHMDTHLDDSEKDLKCNICDRRFSVKNKLKQHILDRHIRPPKIKKKRNYECAFCKKIYKSKTTVQYHKCINKPQIKKHKCTLCDKSYYIPIQLKYHMKIHEIDNKIECKDCNKKFISPCVLQKHLEYHKDLKCEICHEKFVLTSKLRSHMVTHKKPKRFRRKRVKVQSISVQTDDINDFDVQIEDFNHIDVQTQDVNKIEIKTEEIIITDLKPEDVKNIDVQTENVNNTDAQTKNVNNIDEKMEEFDIIDSQPEYGNISVQTEDFN